MVLQKKIRPMIFPRIGRWGIIAIAFILMIAGVRGFRLYLSVFAPNVVKTGVIYIDQDAGFETVCQALQRDSFLTDLKSFRSTSLLKKYPESIKAGAYKLEKGWNNNKLVNLLRSGAQTPVKVTFNNVRFRENLAGKLGAALQPDSLAFLAMLNNDSLTTQLGFTRETFPCLFIPNSYEFYWTTTPEKFAERMKQEYDNFWNETRKKKANDLGFTRDQIVTLASIVQEESNKNDEKPRIAGVYINRLRRGWLLQADPTVKFALGDFTIKRVLTEYLEIDSPYNTYKYTGLPPGPINFPEIASVDAVLNAEEHSFLYFCAKEDFSGYHNFAKSLAEHNNNARKYQAALNRMKIYK